MFRTNQPVTDVAFQDREEELGRLLAVISDLAAGSPSWLAILGSRKIGKTSLILEGARRAQNARVKIASIDTLEDTPVSTEFFRRYALRVLDTVFASEIGESPEALASEPNEYRAALVSAPGFGRLDAAPFHETGVGADVRGRQAPRLAMDRRRGFERARGLASGPGGCHRGESRVAPPGGGHRQHRELGRFEARQRPR